jgi:hypothetical protein
VIDESWLPPLVAFDWNAYPASVDRAHGVFQRDFENAGTRPRFLGRELRLKWHPPFEGKSATFWHFVSEGEDEEARTPVRERFERIAWPRVIIENADNQARVCRWLLRIKGDWRWHLALVDFSYLVVVADRGAYLLPWTAFVVDTDHQRDKLRRQWEEWCRAEAQKS